MTQGGLIKVRNGLNFVLRKLCHSCTSTFQGCAANRNDAIGMEKEFMFISMPPGIDWLLVVRWVGLGLEGAQIMQIMYILNGIEEKEGDSCLSLGLRLHLCPTTELRSDEIKCLHEEFL